MFPAVVLFSLVVVCASAGYNDTAHAIVAEFRDRIDKPLKTLVFTVHAVDEQQTLIEFAIETAFNQSNSDALAALKERSSTLHHSAILLFNSLKMNLTNMHPEAMMFAGGVYVTFRRIAEGTEVKESEIKKKIDSIIFSYTDLSVEARKKFRTEFPKTSNHIRDFKFERIAYLLREDHPTISEEVRKMYSVEKLFENVSDKVASAIVAAVRPSDSH